MLCHRGCCAAGRGTSSSGHVSTWQRMPSATPQKLCPAESSKMRALPVLGASDLGPSSLKVACMTARGPSACPLHAVPPRGKILGRGTHHFHANVLVAQHAGHLQVEAFIALWRGTDLLPGHRQCQTAAEDAVLIALYMQVNFDQTEVLPPLDSQQCIQAANLSLRL